MYTRVILSFIIPDVHVCVMCQYLCCVFRGMLEQACLPPCTEHAYALWLDKGQTNMEAVVQPSPYKQTESISLSRPLISIPLPPCKSHTPFPYFYHHIHVCVSIWKAQHLCTLMQATLHLSIRYCYC